MIESTLITRMTVIHCSPTMLYVGSYFCLNVGSISTCPPFFFYVIRKRSSRKGVVPLIKFDCTVSFCLLVGGRAKGKGSVACESKVTNAKVIVSLLVSASEFTMFYATTRRIPLLLTGGIYIYIYIYTYVRKCTTEENWQRQRGKREKNDSERDAEKAEVGGEAKTEEKKKAKCANNRMDGNKERLAASGNTSKVELATLLSGTRYLRAGILIKSQDKR